MVKFPVTLTMLTDKFCITICTSRPIQGVFADLCLSVFLIGTKLLYLIIVLLFNCSQ